MKPQPWGGSHETSPSPVVMLTSSYPRFPGDGVGSFLEPIAHGVARLGKHVHVVAPWHPMVRRPAREDDVSFHFFRYAPTPRLHVFGYASALKADVSLRPTAYAMTPFAVGAGCLALRRVSRTTRSRVIHAHWVIPSGFMAAVSGIGLPLVISLHGSDVYLAESNPLVGRAARHAFRRAGAVTACSEDLRRRAIALGANEESTTVVPYGVNTDRFKPDATARQRLRTSLGLSVRAPVLVTAGRLVRKKGIEYLLEALALLTPDWPTLTLLVIGDGDLRPELEQHVSRRDLRKHVRFLGALPQEDVGAWFATADIVVIPSIKDDAGNVDGLPNVLLEALATATPVLTTAVGGIESVAIDGRTARVVAERDGVAIADAVNQLLRHPAAAAALGRAARADMCRSHGWSTTARQFDAAYERAIAASL